jgi:hypothetical protein
MPVIPTWGVIGLARDTRLDARFTPWKKEFGTVCAAITNQSNLVTSAEIAVALGVDVGRVRNTIALLSLRPERRAGLTRLFDERAVEQVRVKLASIAAKHARAERQRAACRGPALRRVHDVLPLGVRR